MSIIDLKTEPQIRDFMPFAGLLTDMQVELLQTNCRLLSYRKKESIYRQDTRTSHVMLMSKGLVKIYRMGPGGRSVLLRMAIPGEYIGMLSVMGGQIHRCSAAAVESSEICFMDINAFRNVLLENGEFSLQMMSLISRDGLFIFNRLINQTRKQLPGRMADVLLYFANEIYGSVRFTFPLTRRELAELAGTTKESFIRTLTEFKNDRIIRLDGNQVEIISMDIVKTLSELG